MARKVTRAIGAAVAAFGLVALRLPARESQMRHSRKRYRIVAAPSSSMQLLGARESLRRCT
jgi:hypothetical protein